VLLAIKPSEIGAGKATDGLTLTLSGRNFMESARVILRNRSNGKETIGLLHPDPDGETGQAYFAVYPAAGSYDVIVENPGELTTSLGPLIVHRSSGGQRKTVYLSAGYEPMLPISGQTNDMLESKLYPLGFFASLGVMPFEWNLFSFGVEAAASWNYLNSDYFSAIHDYQVTGHLADIKIQLAALLWLADHRVALGLHGGGGLLAAINFQKRASGVNAEPVNVLFPTGNAELSLLWQFSDSFFALAGIEYLYLFSADQSNPVFLRPFIGIGLSL
jgi:hypothetical protein